jgi:dTMP kinase
MAAGIFVVLEGIEGSGKSTQARLLGEWLGARGLDHVIAREPGGTPLGEEIRRALLHGGDVPARAELLLMLAARAAFVDQVVRPALERGAVVVADRYELSSFAYQGYGRSLPLADVQAANDFATGGLKPDLTIVLDVPLAESDARRAQGRAEADRIERAGARFHERVAEAYRLLAVRDACTEVVAGTGTVPEVHEAILGLLAARFPETFGRTTG